MGNCVCMRHQTTPSTAFDNDDDDGEGMLGGEGYVTSSFSGEFSSSSSPSSSSSQVRKEIKIRMAKKDLEDLMRRIHMKSLTAEEILAKLLILDGGDELSHQNQRSWRPALQSIPESDL